MSDVVIEQLPPDEAFELLGHETRFRILEELGDADGNLSFSELRERVGVRDTGQFNYHLGKLTGRFVTKAEPDDGDTGGDDDDGSEHDDEIGGYHLTGAGRQVVGAVLSGGYTKAMDAETVEMNATCLDCGEPMELAFETDSVRVTCTDCGMQFTDVEVPAGVLEGYGPDAAAAVVDRWLKRHLGIASLGFCPTCHGQLARRLQVPADPDAPDWLPDDDEFEVVSRAECRRCSQNWYSDLGAALLSHPAIVAFHHEHGVDVRSRPMWDHEWLSTKTADVVQREPLRVELALSLDDERLVLTVDRDLQIVEERREPVDANDAPTDPTA
ncbi:winged helix-turn-helix domain-containing protein [Haloarchaeobius sp. TZWWS8]|uniref:winged helix-turn-helix domain-containing protein n=1 Tax=Haloarchaeobius sp. TZWWS8 TaxID=3446121 RepID=UPI003EB92A3D